MNADRPLEPTDKRSELVRTRLAVDQGSRRQKRVYARRRFDWAGATAQEQPRSIAALGPKLRSRARRSGDEQRRGEPRRYSRPGAHLARNLTSTRAKRLYY
jgi:hypothetical protein